MLDQFKRVGIFRVSVELIKHSGYQRMMQLFNDMKVFVIEAQPDIFFNSIQYTAISEQFDEVERGILIPEYDVRITTRFDEESGVSEIEKIEFKHISNQIQYAMLKDEVIEEAAKLLYESSLPEGFNSVVPYENLDEEWKEKNRQVIKDAYKEFKKCRIIT